MPLLGDLIGFVDVVVSAGLLFYNFVLHYILADFRRRDVF